MASALVVRRATKEDMPAVAKLAAGLVRFHHALDAKRFFLQEPVEEGYRWWLSRELADEDAVILVATPGEGATAEEPAILGYAYGRLEERDWNALLDACGMIHDVFVDERSRTRGAGEALVKGLIAELTRKGAPRVVLTTATQNQKAQRLFAKLGFRATMIEMTREADGDGGSLDEAT